VVAAVAFEESQHVGRVGLHEPVRAPRCGFSEIIEEHPGLRVVAQAAVRVGQAPEAHQLRLHDGLLAGLTQHAHEHGDGFLDASKIHPGLGEDQRQIEPLGKEMAEFWEDVLRERGRPLKVVLPQRNLCF
jgi:hypothetical protein